MPLFFLAILSDQYKAATPSRIMSPLLGADGVARYYHAVLRVEWPAGWRPPESMPRDG